jgi:hypothetical protein
MIDNTREVMWDREGGVMLGELIYRVGTTTADPKDLAGLRSYATGTACGCVVVKLANLSR